MSTPQPTEGELALLRVLWARKAPMTVREVHAELSKSKDTAYTTVLKMLTIMADKGLVARDETARAHVYAARVEEADTQRQLVRELLDRAFGGSAAKLVMQALAARRASPEEIAGIRQMLDELESAGRAR